MVLHLCSISDSTAHHHEAAQIKEDGVNVAALCFSLLLLCKMLSKATHRAHHVLTHRLAKQPAMSAPSMLLLLHIAPVQQPSMLMAAADQFHQCSEV